MKKEKKAKVKSRKGEKHQKPLSLYGMSFNEAVSRLLAAKPEPRPRKPKK